MEANAAAHSIPFTTTFDMWHRPQARYLTWQGRKGWVKRKDTECLQPRLRIRCIGWTHKHTQCIQVYKSWQELEYVFLMYLSLTCFKNTLLKKNRCVILLKISTDLCCTFCMWKQKMLKSINQGTYFSNSKVIFLWICKWRTKVQNFLTCCLLKEETPA